MKRVEVGIAPGQRTVLRVERDGPLEVRNRGRDFSALRMCNREHVQRVIVVGTTTMRALESSANERGEVRAGRGVASLTIKPGYRFRVADALLTNFHLPRSSLLILVSAFAGRDLVLRSYRHAVAERYRFYSYGDCMLIL